MDSDGYDNTPPNRGKRPMMRDSDSSSGLITPQRHRGKRPMSERDESAADSSNSVAGGQQNGNMIDLRSPPVCVILICVNQ